METDKTETDAATSSTRPVVAIIMGSKSDWDTMRHADETLTEFGVAHVCHVMSAHRTPQLASEFSRAAASRGVEVIIAAAGGAAHLAGVMAAHTVVPVLGVPMKSDALNGMDFPMASVPTGMPAGICTVASRESMPLRASLFMGTPNTGKIVCAAITPARCAAPPAAAMITSTPREAAVLENSAAKLGVR